MSLMPPERRPDGVNGSRTSKASAQRGLARRRAVGAAPIAVASLVALWLTGAPSAGQNLIQNPGFEDGESPLYPGVGLHWETNDAQPHPEIDVLTTDTKHSGSWSQWLKAHPEWDLGMVRQVTPYNSIIGGQTYKISAWIKTANVQNPAGWYVFGIWWMNNEGQVVGDKKMDEQETLNYDWREIVIIDTAPASATRVATLLTRHTDGDAWYDDVYIGEYTPGPPEITRNPASFTHKIYQGNNLPNDSFTVQNTGGGTLNYSITDDADWLDADPPTGSNDGEVDTIALQYSVSTLNFGTYDATVSITDPNATNSPQTIAVTVIVTLPGDFDYDGDVDQEDFGRFQVCYTGPGVNQDDAACADAKLDGDVDVDQDDFGIFQDCMSGPGVPGNPQCAG